MYDTLPIYKQSRWSVDTKISYEIMEVTFQNNKLGMV